MFERFTERSRKVVVLAQEEARRLRHGYIGTEHLLLGLVRQEDGAAQILVSAGVTLAGVREQVEGIVGFGEEIGFSQAPFNGQAKAALELSLSEALQLRHNYIGTEHLLLGLLRENGETSRMILGNLGVEPSDIRRAAMDLVAGTMRAWRAPNPLELTREVIKKSFGRYSRADRSLFDNFAEQGRRIVVLAQDEARYFDHNYIGTEHLLLGVIREEEGIAARTLDALGVRLDEAREQVESIVGYGERAMGPQTLLTPRSKKILQLAEREALQLGHAHVGTEHILIGLARESEGVAARVLLNLDVDPDAVRREVVGRLLDAEDETDPFDEAERETEEAGQRLFRGRVLGIKMELDLPRPLAVTVDADYAYRTPLGSLHSSTTVEPGDVADQIRDRLRETEARELEAVIVILGESMLNTFPAMLEVGVTISGVPEPADPLAPTFSVSSTFRR